MNQVGAPVAGGIYCTTNADGTYRIVKVLLVEDGIVHIRPCAGRLPHRPTAAELASHPGATAGGVFIGHLPISESLFQSWRPELLATVEVLAYELEGYQVWKEGEGGVFTEPTAKPATPSGERVLAQWPGDHRWYPATIESRNQLGVVVRYDDGDSATVLPSQLAPLDPTPGDRVYARWRRGSTFYPGTLARVDGNRVTIHYDDGDVETTTLDVIAMPQRPRRTGT